VSFPHTTPPTGLHKYPRNSLEKHCPPRGERLVCPKCYSKCVRTILQQDLLAGLGTTFPKSGMSTKLHATLQLKLNVKDCFPFIRLTQMKREAMVI
jgi:hypothetical protein